MNCAFRLFSVLLTTMAALPSQQGGSSHGHARTRELAALGLLPVPADVAVADLINYHRHRLPLPRAGEAVALDLRFGAATVGRRGQAVLQIGFTTPPSDDRRDLPPLNLGLVIDCSGSMADRGKMDQVQRGLLAMCERLRPADRVALIGYSDDAWVVQRSRSVGDRQWLRDAIGELRPKGSTNLHAGLMLGLQQVQEHRLREGSNRVVLLTDGLANRGETDPEAILRAAQRFTGDGIDLSTVGVGQDINTALLDRLARGGRGLFHFVAEAQDVQKVFVSELSSLLAPAARGVRLLVDVPEELELERVYGHESKRHLAEDGCRGFAVALPDLNRGVTAVVLASFRCGPRAGSGQRLTVRARIDYQDAEQKAAKSQSASAVLQVADDLRDAQDDGGDHAAERQPRHLADAEVRKNFTIAVLAQALHDMARSAQDQRWSEADRGLRRGLALARAWFPSGDDQDVERVRAMADGHLRTLQGYVDRFGDR